MVTPTSRRPYVITQVAPTPADAEELRRRHDRLMDELSFWAGNRMRLTERYPDKVIAVKDGEVIAACDDLHQLRDTLRKRGLKGTDVWMEYMDSRGRRLPR